MNIQAEKLDLIQWLAGIDDSKVIKQFMLLKKSNEKITDVDLSKQEKHAIDIGLKSMEESRFKSHEKVVEATRKKYPNLFK